MKNLEPNFKELIDQIASSNSFNVVCGRPGTGISTFLLEFCRYVHKTKKVLLIHDEPLWIENALIKNGISKDDIDIVSKRNNCLILDEMLDSKKLDAYDIILIDNFNHFTEDSSRVITTNICHKLSFLKKTVIVSQSFNRSAEGLNYSILHLASNIVEISLGTNPSERIITTKKRRDGDSKIVFLIRNNEGETFSIFDKVFSKTFKLFNKEMSKSTENNLLFSMHKFAESNISDYLPNLSKKQYEKLENIIFPATEYLPNLTFVNSLEMFKQTYKDDFNIDDFICNDGFVTTAISYLRITQSTVESANTVMKFFKDNISYKRAKTIVSKFLKNDKDNGNHGFNLLFSVGITYCEILDIKDKLLKLKDINSVEMIDELINKKNFRKKTLLDIIVILYDVLTTSKILTTKYKEEMLNNKQREFKEKNKANPRIEVPVNIREIVKGSKFFNNCTSGASFLKTLSEDSTLLFYIRLNNKNKKYCVHISNQKKMIEVKGIRNELLTPEELSDVNSVIDSIII